MIGGSESYTIHLDDNTIYVIKVKRPQFLITSLKRRKEYLFTLSENKSDINTIMFNDYNIESCVNAISANFNIGKINNFIEKLNSLIDYNISVGVNNTRQEMHIIGLQILLRNLQLQIYKINIQRITDHLQMENQRLNALLDEKKRKSIDNDDAKKKEYKHTMGTIIEEGGLLRKKSNKKKSIRNNFR